MKWLWQRQLKNTRQSNTQRDGEIWQQKRIKVIRLSNNNSHNNNKIIIVIIINTSVFWGCACLFSLSSWSSYPSTLFDCCIIIAVAVAVAVAGSSSISCRRSTDMSAICAQMSDVKICRRRVGDDLTRRHHFYHVGDMLADMSPTIGDM
jgi:hypothetical protein